MTDRQSDTSPDSPPRDDHRGSVETVDTNPADRSPDPRNGAVGGTDGVTKNQGDDAQ